MELTYDFLPPGKIVFGWGRRQEVGRLAGELGNRAFVVCGSRTLDAGGEIDNLTESLTQAGVRVRRLFDISHEPQVEDVDRCTDRLHAEGAGNGDLLLAVGGGSAIDLAKAAAAMITNRQSPSVADYLEGVGRGLKLLAPPLPVLAMPTTGGTGSEATKNAVISSYSPPFKKSLRHDLMVPHTVLVDPELSVGVPPATTAWTGMDAITQLIESYVSRFARPLPRAIALGALRLALPALPEAVRSGGSRPAREAMAHAALMSGMALAHSGLGLAHGVAAALGVHGKVTHGLACAVMLPVALRVNRPVCEKELAELARGSLAGNWPSDAAAADAFVQAIDELSAAVGVPKRLAELGIRRKQLPDLVASSRGNSMSGNPVQLSDDELGRLLEELL
ncbi:MAG TPA: iron-containing alcohol dehydrogenase [Pirellulales bacterium]|jgi:alcohol dehydrogenase class IV|nr:iron-containing alcohol dehydrogenase [Pirellulales bacterium]